MPGYLHSVPPGRRRLSPQSFSDQKILIECDCRLDVAYFNGDVITAINLHTHDSYSRDVQLLRVFLWGGKKG
jgi:hypothetical protein